jgi:predicted flap endonuclease-1-like 5' DNA nuclease
MATAAAAGRPAAAASALAALPGVGSALIGRLALLGITQPADERGPHPRQRGQG